MVRESVIVENLKNYIKERGIKVSSIEEKTGIDLYSKLSGRSSLRVNELEKVCEALGVRVAELES